MLAFKLAAPRNTTVEVDYDGNGTVTMLQVSPAARNGSLIFANCVDESISRKVKFTGLTQNLGQL